MHSGHSFIINLPHMALPDNNICYGYNMKNKSCKAVLREVCLGKRLLPCKHGANVGQKRFSV